MRLVGRFGLSDGGGGGGGLFPVGAGLIGFPLLCWFKAAMRAWRDVNCGSTSAIVSIQIYRLSVDSNLRAERDVLQRIYSAVPYIACLVLGDRTG